MTNDAENTRSRERNRLVAACVSPIRHIRNVTRPPRHTKSLFLTRLLQINRIFVPVALIKSSGFYRRAVAARRQRTRRIQQTREITVFFD